MAYYKVVRQTFINGQQHEIGDIIDWTGTPNTNLVASNSTEYLAQFAKPADWVQPGNPLTNPQRIG